jgi:hypothetical protein
MASYYSISRSWFLAQGAKPDAALSAELYSVYRRLTSFILNDQLLFDHGGTPRQGQLLHYYAAAREVSDRVEVLEFLLTRGAAPLNDVMYQDRSK